MKKNKPKFAEGSKVTHPWLGQVKLLEYSKTYSLILVSTGLKSVPLAIKRVQTRLLTK
jgi:hypothetical protein